MNKRETIRKYASTEDDCLLLARLFDKQEASCKKNYLTETRFLSERELAIAQTALRGEKITDYAAWGGYEGAERKLIVFFPDYYDEASAVNEAGISYIRAAFHTSGSVGHRDILGSLMNIGITRECLGDIVVHDKFCDIICVNDSAEFIVNNLFRAGRETLDVKLLDSPPEPPEIKTETFKDTVASLRLDAIVASCCRVSRTKAAELISAAKVKLDGLECLKADKILEEGCGISVRGSGKYVLESVNGVSKKGRVIVEIKKFV